MADKKNMVQLPQPTAAEVEFAQQLVERAKAEGVSLVGPGGLLAGITRTVLESALDAELDAHLDEVGVDEESGRRVNVRNGHGAKTVQTEVGPVRIQVPRDRAGSFTPRIVPKHVRRLEGFNEAILSLYAKGLTTGEISAHLADVYDADVSRELISRVTDSVVDEMEAWRQRPLDRIYPVVFIDALVMKIRQGQVANRPVYVVVGISLDGERDVLGMWAGTGGEGAKQWAGYLTELRNRGVEDVFMVCSDGLKGMTDAIEQVWPQAVHQQCVVHLVRASLRYTNRKDWQKITPALREIYTAPTIAAAEARFEAFATEFGDQYPAVIRLWRTSWPQFVPFLDYDHEVRKVLYTTNIIESLNARFRQAARRRGHFPTEQAAMKVLYLVVQQKRRGGGSITGRVYGWAKALNALILAYSDRITI
ncbi:IS256 family transposase [Micromonospora humidisoli]|uniref:Mutator family transposase n=2 Tax=Micromonosporaceae TaxID=28056 RepID=A0ABS2IVD8_9ACTN|nr:MULTISPECIES: IS256 family transposase [Micromonospora]MBM7077328.1 IS256 family transposase [Micromonospora humida]GHJ08809.1 IS256 family transposase [Micromonospora sp. AKA109]